MAKGIYIKMHDDQIEQLKNDAANHNMNQSQYIKFLIDQERRKGGTNNEGIRI